MPEEVQRNVLVLYIRQLFLARDRIGIKPLYYYSKNKKFIFASEIKSILECDIKREVNIDSLNKFMMLRYTPGEETMFSDIKRLKSGHSMVFDLETRKPLIQKYWDVVESVQNKSEDYFSHKLLSLLKESVERRLVGDVPLGAYLSGGIDSSTIVAIMRKLNPGGDIKTFSVAFEEATKYNELSEARIASEHFETDHKEFIIDNSVLKTLPEIVWHMDEPLADPAIIPNFFLSREAKKDVTIILTGDGSDELFAGYDQYRFLVMERHLRKLPRPVVRTIPNMIRGFPDSLMDKIYKQGTDTGKQEMIRRLEKSITSGRNHAKAYLEIVSIYDEDEREKVLAKNVKSQIDDFNCYDSFNKDYLSKPSGYLNRFQYFDIKALLPECYLMKLDKMTMAHSIEGRVPFLDHEIAEFSMRIPPGLKLKNNVNKYVLKKAVQGLVPPSTTKRKKQTFFVPINKWVTNNYGHFQDLLSKEELRGHGLFSHDCINRILQRRSKLFYARQLWNLINFQIWHKIYIDKEPPGKIHI